jgi:Na+-transporting methylmalonyl-CoA/oxaloacetate decarboxylase gamma subunit
MNNMLIALQITALGMGLVFGAILVLWAMMIVLTALTADKDVAAPQPQVPANSPEAAPVADADLRAQAAAAAVAVAMMEQQRSNAHALRTPPTAIVSAWQLGMRTRQMSQKGLPIRHGPRQTG